MVEQRLSGFVEQFPADQHATDFAGAGANFEQLGIAQQATRGEFVDVAIATHQLNGIQRLLCGALGGKQNERSGILAAVFTAVACPGNGIGVGP
jgi:hypothetical protein